MAVFLQQRTLMRNLYLLSFTFTAFILLTGCHSVSAQNSVFNRDLKIQNVIYFNPEVFPDIDEIKEPTYSAFYSAVSDRISHFRNYKMLRVDANLTFDSADVKTLKEFCDNNNAQFAVVPKVKYFKVGLGKYVFSNQVIVSLKLYDSEGNFITETDYDTYKKNARLLGSAENSIKIGTTGAMKGLGKNLRKIKKDYVLPIEN